MTKSEVIEMMAAASTVAANAALAVQNANITLKQAHDEGWPDDDERWKSAFANLDPQTEAAIARL